MDNEAEVRLVEAHAKSHGSHECLYFIGQQRILQRHADIILQGAGVCLHPKAAVSEPRRNALGIAHGQRVHDATTRQSPEPLG